jgi:Insertion element 4 transposase N-terminal
VTEKNVPRYSGTSLTDRIGIGVLTRLVNRDLIDEVLAEKGRREQRTRLLPARVVVYYVMALCLFFSDAYEEVMRRLVGGLEFLGTWDGKWNVPTTGAISQARARLGEAPMRVLYERVAQPMARPGTRGAWYQSWRLMAIDGVVFDVPDTPANAAEFNRSGNHLADSPFPQVRVVGLAECGTHAIVGASIGGIKQYERELLTGLLPSMAGGMLVLADRGFYSYETWKEARTTGADLLWRLVSKIDLPVYELLPDGSYRSALLPKSMRSDLRRGKKRLFERYEIPVRVIEYRVANRNDAEETIRLVTSLAGS